MTARTLRSRRAIPRRAGYTWSEDALPTEIEIRILGLLPRQALGRLASVSKSWRELATAKEMWQSLCEREWNGKMVLDETRARAVTDPRSALRSSLCEAKECLIDVATLVKLSWSFRFKKGSGWASDDPYFQGGFARTLRFMPDQTIRWEGESSWTGFTYELRRWTGFTPARSTIRVSHEHMGTFPEAIVHRHPNNWGFILNGPWTVMTSFPMCKALDHSCVSDRTLARRVEPFQWRQAHLYNASIASSEDESEDGGEDGEDESEDSE